VDNSIAAGARKIDIGIVYDDGPPKVFVADNGAGMTRARLAEALRLGSIRDYECDDLGKFGLGLKTASLSQCRRLTVLTRHSPNYYRVASATLDIDEVAQSKRWQIIEDASDGALAEAARWLGEDTGTVVIWEKLDRLVSSEDRLGGWDKRRLRSLAEATRCHLAMVFHRFLERTGKSQLRINVNGKRVASWDPYAQSEKHTQTLPPQAFELTASDGNGVVLVCGHILPPRDLFSTQEAFESLSGPRKWNRQQGFYIYRNGRLIQSGGWCNMRAADEHTKLARVSIDFPSSLDALFNVNIAKMRVAIPSQLRMLLDRVVLDIVKLAQTAYRGDLKVVRPDDDQPRVTARSPAATHAPAYGEFMIALRAAALASGQSKALSKIFGRLCKDAPEFAALAGLAIAKSSRSKKRRLAPDVG
jgi:hypothetical protein